MIAKIMKSSNSFQAVYYNENKIVEQKAELLAAVNFEGNLTAVDFWGKNDYIKYFNEISNLNPRVQRKQFHAVISTKGHEHSAAELKTIAEEYVKRMGYGENPYLLYFHQDTENNHVHIVSTRVNTEGVKIKDSFEKKESLRHISNIMQQIPHRELNGKNIADDVMKYSFSTEAQLKLLIEQKGYSTKNDEERNLIILKDNRPFATISRLDIVEKLKHKPDAARINQLKAVLHKYKDSLSPEDLQKFMKEKFGVEMIFHKNGGHDKPYGYTIIDHATKQVFKGSEVMKIGEILKEGRSEEIKNPNIEALRERKNDKDRFNDYLIENDLFVMSRGGNTFLIDRANNEALNVSEHDFFREHSFMDLNESQKVKLNIDLSIGISGSDSDETDRKKKREKANKNGYSY
jgi:hypothetical protein